MRRSLTAAITVLLAGSAAIAQPRVVTVSNQLLYAFDDAGTRI